jgi:NADPH2:quinone reductase
MQAVNVTLKDPTAATRETIITFSASHTLPTPKDGEVLVEVFASPIEPSDILNVRGDFPHTTFPRIPGRNFAGLVTAPTNHRLYQKRVFGTSGSQIGFTRDGAHAEFIIVSDKAVALVPPNLSLKAASLMGTSWTTAYLALTRLRLTKGETVMVLGAGGSVGDAAVQLAGSSLFGCKVLRAGRGDRYDVDTGHLEQVLNKTGGKGVDAVVDTTGDHSIIKATLSKMAKGGRIAGKISGQSPFRVQY